jgi:hypothetical protein
MRMVDYQTISIVLTGLGIMGAIIYYTLTLRNAIKTRQTQLFMQIFQELNSEKSWNTWGELMNADLNNYDDFMEKYDSSVNPEFMSKRNHIWYSYHCIGCLLWNGTISIELVNNLVGMVAIMQWRKWGDIIKEIRVKQGMPNYYNRFEYLVNELVKYHEEHPEAATLNQYYQG